MPVPSDQAHPEPLLETTDLETHRWLGDPKFPSSGTEPTLGHYHAKGAQRFGVKDELASKCACRVAHGATPLASRSKGEQGPSQNIQIRYCIVSVSPASAESVVSITEPMGSCLEALVGWETGYFEF